MTTAGVMSAVVAPTKSHPSTQTGGGGGGGSGTAGASKPSYQPSESEISFELAAGGLGSGLPRSSEQPRSSVHRSTSQPETVNEKGLLRLVCHLLQSVEWCANDCFIHLFQVLKIHII